MWFDYYITRWKWFLRDLAILSDEDFVRMSGNQQINEHQIYLKKKDSNGKSIDSSTIYLNILAFYLAKNFLILDAEDF